MRVTTPRPAVVLVSDGDGPPRLVRAEHAVKALTVRVDPDGTPRVVVEWKAARPRRGKRGKPTVRRVRTPEGARRYGQPIGAVIVVDPATGKARRATSAEEAAAGTTGTTAAPTTGRGGATPETRAPAAAPETLPSGSAAAPPKKPPAGGGGSPSDGAAESSVARALATPRRRRRASYVQFADGTEAVGMVLDSDDDGFLLDTVGWVDYADVDAVSRAQEGTYTPPPPPDYGLNPSLPQNVRDLVTKLRHQRGLLPEDTQGWSDRQYAHNMVIDDQGHSHWGANGAAGVLVRHVGADGTPRYLVQKRAPGVQHANTWSTPGGAIDEGETPAEAAAREAAEELGLDASTLSEAVVSSDDHGGWSYHTVVLDSPEMFDPSPTGGAEHAWEQSDAKWMTAGEIAALGPTLHPGFAATYQSVIAQAETQRTGNPVTADAVPAPAVVNPSVQRGPLTPQHRMIARLTGPQLAASIKDAKSAIKSGPVSDRGAVQALLANLLAERGRRDKGVPALAPEGSWLSKAKTALGAAPAPTDPRPTSRPAWGGATAQHAAADFTYDPDMPSDDGVNNNALRRTFATDPQYTPETAVQATGQRLFLPNDGLEVADADGEVRRGRVMALATGPNGPVAYVQWDPDATPSGHVGESVLELAGQDNPRHVPRAYAPPDAEATTLPFGTVAETAEAGPDLTVDEGGEPDLADAEGPSLQDLLTAGAPAPDAGEPGSVTDIGSAEAPPGVPQSADGNVTEAMEIAKKQGWKLPPGTVEELTAQLAAVTPKVTPTVDELMASGMDAKAAVKEAKRLARNAQVNEWRQRKKLQAAIDTLLAEDAQGKPGGLKAATAPKAVKKPAKPPAAAPEEPPAPAAPEEPPAAEEPAPAAPEVPTPALDLDPDDPRAMDALLTIGDPPKALYDTVPGDVGGPGSVASTEQWYDVLAAAGADSEPIPVSGLTIEGYKVQAGIAYRSGGRSYLVEIKEGESADEAMARAKAAQTTMESVLSTAPTRLHAYQRGLALVSGANPKDAHWAEQFGLDGFTSHATGGLGSTTVWGGETPKPTTLAHEFGHNLDFGVGTGLPGHVGAGLSGAPGKTGMDSWAARVDADAMTSSGWAGRFKETRVHPFVKPIVLGKSGVTEYGQVNAAEDFAESVRLWLKDRREGKVGYDPSTSTNVRFHDLFPARGALLDAMFSGEDGPYEESQVVSAHASSAASMKRRMEAATEIAGSLRQMHDEGVAVTADSMPSAETVMGLHGLSMFAARKAMLTALERHALYVKEQQEAAEAEAEAAEALAKAQAAKAEAEAQAKVLQDALDNAATLDDLKALGLVETGPNATKLKARVKAARKRALDKGSTPEQADVIAAAYEAKMVKELVAKAAAEVAAQSPAKAASSPEFKSAERKKAATLFTVAGSKPHPLAKEQMGKAQQAKANIAAELGSRLNNKTDWDTAAAYVATDLSWDYNSMGQLPLPAWEDTTPEQRQDILARLVSARIQMWASSSGNTNQPAVLMQKAIKDEFDVPGHPAPRMTASSYAEFMERYDGVAPFYRRLARVMYEHTQEDFKARGIKNVSVYRGMSFGANPPDWAKIGTVSEPDLQPANSWSTQLATSAGFGSTMFSMSVPVERVLGSALTGFGCLNETEYVILHGDGQAKVTTVSDAPAMT